VPADTKPPHKSLTIISGFLAVFTGLFVALGGPDPQDVEVVAPPAVEEATTEVGEAVTEIGEAVEAIGEAKDQFDPREPAGWVTVLAGIGAILGRFRADKKIST
jgi:hypothetical protein